MSAEHHRIEVRPAAAADFPVIAALAGRIWRTCFPGLISPEQIEYMLARRYTPEAMHRAVSRDRLTYLLGRLNGQAIAFAADGPGGSADEWKLHQLYVDPEWQGVGIGRRLIELVEGRARRLGARELVLTVNKANERARRLYERAGFSLRDAVVTDIGGGFVMDDYVMARPLAPPGQAGAS